MKVPGWLLALSLGMAAPAAAQAPGLDVDLRAGVNITSIGDAPDGYETSDDLGYFVGGDIRFGKFFFVQPGLYYQHQTVNFEAIDGESDGLGVSSFMIPLQVGIDVDLKILGAEIGVGFRFVPERANRVRFDVHYQAYVAEHTLEQDLVGQIAIAFSSSLSLRGPSTSRRRNGRRR